MKGEGRFGVQEATWLSATAIIAKVFFTSPAAVVSLVGPAGWYMTMGSAVIALIGFAFITRLLKRFPNRGLPEIYELALGRVKGFLF